MEGCSPPRQLHIAQRPRTTVPSPLMGAQTCLALAWAAWQPLAHKTWGKAGMGLHLVPKLQPGDRDNSEGQEGISGLAADGAVLPLQEYGVPFMETSAKTGMNVELAFLAIAK